MRTLFLSSSGLNEKTTKLFWKCIGKEPQNTKVIFVPSAAIGNDDARDWWRKRGHYRMLGATYEYGDTYK